MTIHIRYAYACGRPCVMVVNMGAGVWILNINDTTADEILRAVDTCEREEQVSARVKAFHDLARRAAH